MDPTQAQIIAAANAGRGQEFIGIMVSTGVEVALCVILLLGVLLLLTWGLEAMTDEDD